jgi:hypothetical protein
MKELIPLLAKNVSTDSTDNFLINEDNIYVMDNHRLALWCWFNKINVNNKYNLIHIDAHPDLSASGIADYLKLNKKVSEMSLEEYRSIMQGQYNVPLFRWDNYLKVFIESHKENYIPETSLSFTHHLGSSDKLSKDLSSIFILRELENVFDEKLFINNNKWIVNLDLDYFFTTQPHKKLLFTKDFMESIACLLKKGIDQKLIEVLTIALSPECCGSWENAEIAYEIFKDKLNLKFDLCIN